MNENEKITIELMANAIRNTEFRAGGIGDLPLALASTAFDALPIRAKQAIRGDDLSDLDLIAVTLPRMSLNAMQAQIEKALSSA